MYKITRLQLKLTATKKYGFRRRHSFKRTFQETAVRFDRVKRSRLSVVIGLFRSIYQGSLAVAMIMINGSKKRTS